MVHLAQMHAGICEIPSIFINSSFFYAAHHLNSFIHDSRNIREQIQDLNTATSKIVF